MRKIILLFVLICMVFAVSMVYAENEDERQDANFMARYFMVELGHKDAVQVAWKDYDIDYEIDSEDNQIISDERTHKIMIGNYFLEYGIKEGIIVYALRLVKRSQKRKLVKRERSDKEDHFAVKN